MKNMKRKHRSMVLASFILLAAFHKVEGQNTPPLSGSKAEISDDISLVLQFPLTRRSETASVTLHLLEHRTNFTQYLTKLMVDTPENPINRDVIVVLGEYRISESVPFLVQHLDLDFKPIILSTFRAPPPNQPIYMKIGRASCRERV